MSLLEQIFEFLFKYPRDSFAAGTLGFAPGWPLLVGGGLAVVLGLPVLWQYLRSARRGRRQWLVVLRIALLALVLVCLARPILSIATVVPQQSFVGVLLDDSSSMKIADGGGVVRAQQLLDLIDVEGGNLLGALGERFNTRLFSFADSPKRIEGAADLAFEGGSSDIGRALEGSVGELSGVPLSGLVLLTDGAHNSDTMIEDVLLDLKARSLPVFAVGFGDDSFERDIEVSRVEAPRKVLKGSSLMVEVTVAQRGFDGESVTLEVEDQGRIVNTQPVSFSDRGEAAVVRVNFEATEAGPREFNFRIAPQRGEAVAENNNRATLIQVEDRVQKILYFEGEPRWELKFIKRAVEGDENLQLVILQRTAENRFSRFNLDAGHEDDLEGGFPTTREELFRYQGLILGSIEASFFTFDQLRMIAEFVAERGGGFLMIGGRNAFSEGGWAGTPVADVLPVKLGPAADDEGQPFFSELQVELTAYGKTHPATQLADTEDGSEERWRELPAVSTFNPISEIKPGATSLVVGRGDGLADEQVVLAFQRFGRGRALAWTVHDSWHWQMHADIPLEDMTHERLWRQLARWLVSYVPDRVSLESVAERVGVGDEVELVAEVMDDGYLAVNNADVVAEVHAPSGEVTVVPLAWSVEADGEYRGSFAAHAEGTYRIAFEASVGNTTLGGGESYMQTAEMNEEYFDAELHRALLEEITSATGGEIYDIDDADRMVAALSSRAAGSTVIDRHELWDMPLLFLLAVSLMGAEWGLRRRMGLE